MGGSGVGAVVLAGGRSARMGEDKAWLDWEGQPLLAHTCTLLAGCIEGPVLVVRSSPDQSLPPLPEDVQVVDDPEPGQGPLLGVAVGLAAVGRVAEVAFVCATDLPLLHPAFVRRLVAALRDPGADPVDVALPVVGGSWHPLAAAYCTGVADEAREAVRSGRRRVTDFVASRRHLLLDESRLLADPAVAAADPLLHSVLNVNDPTELARARAVRRG
ncbi:MAG TPA: molybdenum cofactor guanylyltransferase [Actinomycetes bacterium]|nr:molybdenum cofactor guanylyltransferase [Actinomycetes bacterium]